MWPRLVTATEKLCGRTLHYLPGLQEFNEKTPAFNKCPRMGPRKRSQKKADGQEASLNRLVLLTLFFFFFNHTQNLHILQSFQNANQNSEVLPHMGQNDLCQKVYKH